MQEAQSDNRNNLTVKGWCTDVIEIMRQAIDEATQLNSPPLKFQKSKAKRSRAEIKQYKAVIRAFPVIGVIPAGTPVELNVKKGDWSISDTVQILNNQYECYSLRGKNEIAIHSGWDYFALQVTGNSMNLSTPVNINDGDYVLMRKQDDAENGEIVAVEIIGEDREATLKKYLIQNNEYILLPQSDDPNFQEKIRLKKDFHIRGIALAVLKPVD
jgi:SOS-response transcriptional repressor LexA